MFYSHFVGKKCLKLRSTNSYKDVTSKMNYSNGHKIYSAFLCVDKYSINSLSPSNSVRLVWASLLIFGKNVPILFRNSSIWKWLNIPINSIAIMLFWKELLHFWLPIISKCHRKRFQCRAQRRMCPRQELELPILCRFLSNSQFRRLLARTAVDPVSVL